MKHFFQILIIVGCLAVAGVSAQTITIDNEGKQTTVSCAEIAKIKRVTLKMSDHGKDATFEGVPLVEVLKLGGVEFGEKLRGKRLATFLLVEASDGYKAVYALPELDPEFTDKRVILADKRDGKDLPENARSFQIVVEGDKRPARWIRQVTKLRILQAGN
jgi:hypothetical protein